MIAVAVIAALGLGAVATGSLLDWVALDLPFLEQFLQQLPGAPPSLALQGTDIAQGKFLLVAGGVGAVAALIGVMPGLRRAAGVVAVAVGASALSIAGTDVAMALQVPEVPLPEAPGLLPTELPSLPGLPTNLPGLPTEIPADIPTISPTTTPAASIRQIPAGASLRLDVGMGLWLVLGGGLVALVAGAVLALARTEVPRQLATSPDHAAPAVDERA